ncbi:MAG: ATP-dependent DNA helicase [Thermoplasmata archaeon]
MLELKKKSMAREVWQCTKCGATYGTNIGRCGCEVAEEKRHNRALNSKRTKKMTMPKDSTTMVPKNIFHRFSQRERAAMLGKLEDYIDDLKAKRSLPEKPDMFPFERIRDGQKEFLQDARSVVENGKHIIAHAPTGIGKTAAALSATLEYSLPHEKQVFFLTSRQSQHKIAINTLRMIRDRCATDIVAIDVISKQNMCPKSEAKGHYQTFKEFCEFQVKKHRCEYHENYSMSAYGKLVNDMLHVDELKNICVELGMCPHRAALDVGKHADIIVCDYNYIFSDMLDTMLDKFEKGLEDIILIVDEAHNLPHRIRQHLSDYLTPFTIKETLKEVKRYDRPLQRHLEGFMSLFDKLARDVPVNEERIIEKALVVGKIEDSLKGGLETSKTFEDFIDRLTILGKEVAKKGSNRSLSLEMADFLRGWINEYPSCLRLFQNEDLPKLSYKVLDPSVMSKEVFASVYASILMSGTLYPTKMYADILGISEDKAILKEYTSPFPKENRPVVVTNELTTAYKKRGPKMYKNIADSIVGITNHIKGNLAVFFQSYQMLSNISKLMSHNLKKRIIIEDREMSKQDKDKIHNILVKSRKEKGAILLGVMGGSLSEGIDYHENVLESVIVVGLPLAPPSLEVEALQNYYTRKFDEEKGLYYGYINSAMNKVTQALGRCIRSEKDRAVVVLMDERFKWDRYKRCFPKDIDLIITSSPEILVSRFFRDGNPAY